MKVAPCCPDLYSHAARWQRMAGREVGPEAPGLDSPFRVTIDVPANWGELVGTLHRLRMDYSANGYRATLYGDGIGPDGRFGILADLETRTDCLFAQYRNLRDRIATESIYSHEQAEVIIDACEKAGASLVEIDMLFSEVGPDMLLPAALVLGAER